MVSPPDHPHQLKRPFWFLNLCSLTDWTDGSASLYSMAYWSPRILSWLNEVKVKGDSNAEAMARVLKRLWRRHVKLEKIGGDLGGLANMVQVDRRLKGLV